MDHQQTPTKLEYYDNMWKLHSEATFLSLLQTEVGGRALTLDSTIFHPQGGGQPSDTGFITVSNSTIKFVVEDVRSKDGIVYHYGHVEDLEASLEPEWKIEKGTCVQLHVDESRRNVNSRLHSAGHLLDISIRNVGLGHLVPGKANHFPDGPWVEYKGILAQTELKTKQEELEKDVIALISRGGKVSVAQLPYEEAAKLCGGQLPHYIPKGSSPRIVQLGENLGCPCGGTHVLDISEIRRIKVINHGIEENLLDSVESMAIEFFMLPLEEKQKYRMTQGTLQGYGQAFVFSDQQKLDWCNMFALAVDPPFIRNPMLWPTKPLMFSETIETYQTEIRKLSKKLLRYIAMSLDVRAETFEEIFGEAVQAIRMNYYPPCPRPDLVLGLSPHSDGSAFTILQQKRDSYVGLQFLKDNNWVSVHPLQNALLVNIGDTIEVLTNGKYRSIEHRVVTNEMKDRLSIVTFYAPGYQVELGPMSEFVNQNNPLKYRKYNHGDYSKHYVSNKLQGKKTLDFAKIQTNTMA